MLRNKNVLSSDYSLSPIDNNRIKIPSVKRLLTRYRLSEIYDEIALA